MEIFLHPMVPLNQFLSIHQVPTATYEITTLSLNISHTCLVSGSGLLLASSHKLAISTALCIATWLWCYLCSGIFLLRMLLVSILVGYMASPQLFLLSLPSFDSISCLGIFFPNIDWNSFIHELIRETHSHNIQDILDQLRAREIRGQTHTMVGFDGSTSHHATVFYQNKLLHEFWVEILSTVNTLPISNFYILNF